MKNKTKTEENLLGAVDLWALGLGQVIGAGVITTIGPAIGLTGYSVWLAYLAAIVLGLIINLPIMIFSSITKFSGGDYSVISNLGGERLGGMFIISFFLQMLTMSLYGMAFGIYANSIIPSLNPTLAGVFSVAVFWGINLLGIKNMALLQKIMSAILVLALLGFIAFGIAKGNPAPALDFSGDHFFTNGTAGFISAMMILIYSCQGYKLTVNYGGAAKRPTRDLPRAMFAIIPFLIILYCGAALSNVSILPLAEVSGKPLTVAARAMFSTPLFYLFIIGAPIMALLTSINSTYGMAVGPYKKATADGWLPPIFGKCNKHGAPVLILTIQLVVGIIPIILGYSLFMIVSNIMVITSVFQFLLFIAILQVPKKMPKKLAQSSMHISPKVLYVIVGIACVTQGFILIYSLKSLTLPLAIVNVVLVIICFAYATIRHRNGKTHVIAENMLD